MLVYPNTFKSSNKKVNRRLKNSIKTGIPATKYAYSLKDLLPFCKNKIRRIIIALIKDINCPIMAIDELLELMLLVLK